MVTNMYLQHESQPVYKFKYFTPDNESSEKQEFLKHSQNEDGEAKSKTQSDINPKVKSFLEPGDDTFASIRKRLSTLSLKTGYNKGLEPFVPPPVFRERRFPPRRISSISSRDTTERNQEARAKLNSRTSFLSDDKEFRRSKQGTNSNKKQRASENAAASKLKEDVFSAGQNPELFSRQIQLNDKSDKSNTSRSTSPKSVRSVDSSGKVHLGLIESLDLNEKLKDVERIKARYTSNNFMNSLFLYKLRGHDRCFNPDVTHSHHVPRGTKLPESPRSDSKLSMDSSGSRFTSSSASFNYFIGPNKWEPVRSHVYNQIQAHPKLSEGRETKYSKRKKCVEFNMTPREIKEDELLDPPPTRDGSVSKSPKSILKRRNTESVVGNNRLSPTSAGDGEDEFLANASYRWRFQLPKINSPTASLRPRPVMSFRKKMYHFGDGVSEEFEQVISRYGNCRQNSLVKDKSFVRENSRASKT